MFESAEIFKKLVQKSPKTIVFFIFTANRYSRQLKNWSISVVNENNLRK